MQACRSYSCSIHDKEISIAQQRWEISKLPILQWVGSKEPSRITRLNRNLGDGGVGKVVVE